MNEAFLFGPSRIDPPWLKAFAEGLRATPDWVARGVAVVEARYASDAAARDGFSRIAFGLLRAGDAAQAAGLFERDFALDRMLRWQFLRYLDALLALDRRTEAESRVVDYYWRHPEARDGWAVIAHHLAAKRAWDETAALYQRDQAANRLSPGFLPALAEVEARRDNRGEVEALMQTAAQANAIRPDAYAALARIFHQRAQWQAAAKFFQQEEVAAGQLAPAMLPLWAECEARLGHWPQAETLVARAIATRRARRDDHVRLALARVSGGDWTAADAYMERDRQAAGLSPAALLSWSRIKTELNQFVAAEELVTQAYAADAKVMDGFSIVADGLYRAGQYDEAMALFRRESALHRLGWAGSWRFANRLAERAPADANGAAWVPEMSDFVEATYRGASADFRNGFGRLAQRLWHGGFVHEAVEFMRRDEQRERQSAEFRLLAAEYQLKLGHADEADRLSRSALREHPILDATWSRVTASERAVAVPALDALLAEMLQECRAPRQMWANYLRTNAGRVMRDVINVKRYARVEDHIVDIGCSPPLLLALLHRDGYRKLSAVDPFLQPLAPYLDRAGIAGHHAGVADLPVAALLGTADFVCLCEVVEHVALNLINVLTGIHDMLRPGGKLYLTTPNLRSISGLYALLRRQSGLASKPHETVRAQFDRAGSSSGYFGHLREYTAREIVLLVESCGFKHVASHMDPVSVQRTRDVPRFVRVLERCLPAWRLFGAHVFVRS